LLGSYEAAHAPNNLNPVFNMTNLALAFLITDAEKRLIADCTVVVHGIYITALSMVLSWHMLSLPR